MVLMLTTHPSRDGDILTDQSMQLSPGVDARDYFDPYGNICIRLVAPAGLLEVRSEFAVEDSGLPDEVCPSAQQWDVAALPGDVLPFLSASRYCDTEKLSNSAWSLFGGIQGGWQRAQAICDYAHDRLEFGYHHARGDRTASEGHEERRGVCRDFAHLAVTLSRCMNIPAARVISATSAFLRIRPPWTLAHGMRCSLMVVGSRLTPGTIILGLGAQSLREDVMLPMSLFRRPSVRLNWSVSR
jgi:transglutaminase-like putative cysteine protease